MTSIWLKAISKFFYLLNTLISYRPELSPRTWNALQKQTVYVFTCSAHLDVISVEEQHSLVICQIGNPDVLGCTSSAMREPASRPPTVRGPDWIQFQASLIMKLPCSALSGAR